MRVFKKIRKFIEIYFSKFNAEDLSDPCERKHMFIQKCISVAAYASL